MMFMSGKPFCLTKNEEIDGPSAPEFTLNEFARLWIVLRDDWQVRATLEDTVHFIQTRSWYDAGVTERHFWDTVEKRFQDTQLVVTEQTFTTPLEEVDSKKDPLAQRSGWRLREEAHSMKTFVKSACDKSKASLQNDAGWIQNMLKTMESGDLSEHSKRILLCSQILHIGSSTVEPGFIQEMYKVLDEADYVDEL